MIIFKYNDYINQIAINISNNMFNLLDGSYHSNLQIEVGLGKTGLLLG